LFPPSGLAWVAPVAQPELVERRVQVLQLAPAWLPVGRVFSLAPQVWRQALHVLGWASQQVSVSLSAELEFSLAPQLSPQALRRRQQSRVPAELAHDSLVGLPEPAALPEQREPESAQRSVCLPGWA
jgi:hypothetical protein